MISFRTRGISAKKKRAKRPAAAPKPAPMVALQGVVLVKLYEKTRIVFDWRFQVGVSRGFGGFGWCSKS